jgi:hypothetical protein
VRARRVRRVRGRRRRRRRAGVLAVFVVGLLAHRLVRSHVVWFGRMVSVERS